MVMAVPRSPPCSPGSAGGGRRPRSLTATSEPVTCRTGCPVVPAEVSQVPGRPPLAPATSAPRTVQPAGHPQAVVDRVCPGGNSNLPAGTVSSAPCRRRRLAAASVVSAGRWITGTIRQDRPRSPGSRPSSTGPSAGPATAVQRCPAAAPRPQSHRYAGSQVEPVHPPGGGGRDGTAPARTRAPARRAARSTLKPARAGRRRVSLVAGESGTGGAGGTADTSSRNEPDAPAGSRAMSQPVCV